MLAMGGNRKWPEKSAFRGGIVPCRLRREALDFLIPELPGIHRVQLLCRPCAKTIERGEVARQFQDRIRPLRRALEHPAHRDAAILETARILAIVGPLRRKIAIRLDFSATDANALGALLRSRRKPDAIVCGNDEQAAHLMETLAVLGKHAPKDIAVVGFDDIALARSTTPPLTTISQPVKKLASTAFKSLLARIRYPNNDPREILLDAPLVLRQST